MYPKNKPHTFVRIQVMRFSVGGNDLLKVKLYLGSKRGRKTEVDEERRI